MAYAIVGLNSMMYVDRIIKLMEKVPELLTITGFLKSFLTEFGYKTVFKTIKIKNTNPMLPKMILNPG